MAYCTLADIKSYLSISETTDDALIEQAILAAKNAIDNSCRGIAFDVTVDSTRYFSSDSNLICGRALHLGREMLAAPATTVTVGGTDVTSAVKVYGMPPYWQLVLSGTSGYSWYDHGTLDPEDAISITGKWGYSSTPPAAVKQAAIIWAAHFYQIKDAAPDGNIALNTLGTQQPVQSMPSNVVTLLTPIIQGLF